jgi:hypothetical protein
MNVWFPAKIAALFSFHVTRNVRFGKARSSQQDSLPLCGTKRLIWFSHNLFDERY